MNVNIAAGQTVRWSELNTKPANGQDLTLTFSLPGNGTIPDTCGTFIFDIKADETATLGLLQATGETAGIIQKEGGGTLCVQTGLDGFNILQGNEFTRFDIKEGTLDIRGDSSNAVFDENALHLYPGAVLKAVSPTATPGIEPWSDTFAPYETPVIAEGIVDLQSDGAQASIELPDFNPETPAGTLNVGKNVSVTGSKFSFANACILGEITPDYVGNPPLFYLSESLSGGGKIDAETVFVPAEGRPFELDLRRGVPHITKSLEIKNTDRLAVRVSTLPDKPMTVLRSDAKPVGLLSSVTVYVGDSTVPADGEFSLTSDSTGLLLTPAAAEPDDPNALTVTFAPGDTVRSWDGCGLPNDAGEPLSLVIDFRSDVPQKQTFVFDSRRPLTLKSVKIRSRGPVSAELCQSAHANLTVGAFSRTNCPDLTLDARMLKALYPVTDRPDGCLTVDRRHQLTLRTEAGETVTVRSAVEFKDSDSATGLTKTGPGTLLLAGSLSGFGSLNIREGTLEMSGDNSGYSYGRDGEAPAMYVAPGAVLRNRPADNGSVAPAPFGGGLSVIHCDGTLEVMGGTADRPIRLPYINSENGEASGVLIVRSECTVAAMPRARVNSAVINGCINPPPAASDGNGPAYTFHIARSVSGCGTVKQPMMLGSQCVLDATDGILTTGYTADDGTKVNCLNFFSSAVITAKIRRPQPNTFIHLAYTSDFRLLQTDDLWLELRDENDGILKDGRIRPNVYAVPYCGTLPNGQEVLYLHILPEPDAPSAQPEQFATELIVSVSSFDTWSAVLQQLEAQSNPLPDSRLRLVLDFTGADETATFRFDGPDPVTVGRLEIRDGDPVSKATLTGRVCAMALDCRACDELIWDASGAAGGDFLTLAETPDPFRIRLPEIADPAAAFDLPLLSYPGIADAVPATVSPLPERAALTPRGTVLRCVRLAQPRDASGNPEPYGSETTEALIDANGGSVPQQIDARTRGGTRVLSAGDVASVMTCTEGITQSSSDGKTLYIRYEFGISALRVYRSEDGTGLLADLETRLTTTAGNSPGTPGTESRPARFAPFANLLAETVPTDAAPGTPPVRVYGRRLQFGPAPGTATVVGIPFDSLRGKRITVRLTDR